MTDSDRDLIIKEIKVLIGTPCGDSSKIESESNQEPSGATVNRSKNLVGTEPTSALTLKISYSLFPVGVTASSKFYRLIYYLYFQGFFIGMPV